MVNFAATMYAVDELKKLEFQKCNESQEEKKSNLANWTSEAEMEARYSSATVQVNLNDRP